MLINRPGPWKAIPGTIAYRLFKDCFPCWTTQVFAVTQEEADHYGIRTTGSRAVDNAALSRIVKITIPIARMVEIRQEGGEVMPVKPEHRLMIIDLIKKHMINWECVVRAMDVRKSIPLDDLREMDAFAIEQLEIAKKEQYNLDLDEFRLKAEQRPEQHMLLNQRRALARPGSINDHVKVDLNLPENFDSFDDAVGYNRDGVADEPVGHNDGFDTFRRTHVNYSDAFSGIEEMLTEMNGGSL